MEFEIINAGADGWSTVNEYVWLITEGYQYEPDLVVLAYYVGGPAYRSGRPPPSDPPSLCTCVQVGSLEGAAYPACSRPCARQGQPAQEAVQRGKHAHGRLGHWPRGP